MPVEQYSNVPVDCTAPPDTTQLAGRSVLVTGGANGFGESHVRAFASAGAFVTFGDIDEAKGSKLANELGSNVNFLRCDATSWSEQLALFKHAVAHSPSKTLDVVVANAGISGPDEIFTLEDPTTEPTKPSLPILTLNLIGAMYTFKLGQHYLRLPAHNTSSANQDRDKVFIFKGSLAGLLDQPGSFQYSASKFALRGLMRSSRRTLWREGIRVGLVAPWYTKTTILKPAVIERLESKGITFAEIEDCTTAVLRIAADRSINGRTLAIVPRSLAASGHFDAQMDDDDTEPWKALQELVLAASIRTMDSSVQTAAK